MPNPPYGPDSDRSDLFRKSGASLLIELGGILSELSHLSARPALAVGKRTAKVVREEAEEVQKRIVEFFDEHPKASMKKFVRRRSGKGVDARACRIVGYLGFAMTENGQDCVPIMQAARGACFTSDPAELLECRRAIAALGTHGIVEVERRQNDGLWHPRVRLGGTVMLALSGGDRCIPIVTRESLTEIADERRRRLRRLGSRPRKRARPSSARTGVARLVESIPVATPREMCGALERQGYVGQQAARRAVALAAYRHLQRLRRIHLDGAPREELPPPSNLLCIGPTGCGKSHLMRTMFEASLLLPTAVLDITAYTEAGYVGNDVSCIPTHLLLKADGDAGAAQCGIVVLDEIDKIAEDRGGQTRVSRHGVQRSLLKLLDPGTVEIPADLNGYHWRQRKLPFRTHDLLWIACGAFTGLEAGAGVAGRIGFDGDDRHAGRREAPLSASDFQKFGLLPELVGRFHRWVRFDALSREQLSDILRKNCVEGWRRELGRNGVSLSVDGAAMELLVEKATARGTGARGIEAEMVEALEEASFEAYSSSGSGRTIRLHAEGGEVRWDVSTKPKGAKTTFQELREIVESCGEEAG